VWVNMTHYPRTFSHIVIFVPDVEKAAKFYSEVMGWYHIMEPTAITKESDTPLDPQAPKFVN